MEPSTLAGKPRTRAPRSQGGTVPRHESKALSTMAIRDRAPATESRTIVGNRYEIDLGRPLGQGGMAVVYRGRDLRSNRNVAIKTLLPQYQRNPDSRKQFRQEARMMAFVSHPRVVPIYDLYEDEAGSWVIMELVPGENLKQAIERRGPMTPTDVMPLLEELASALDAFHKRELVHLDIKPQNIMLTPDGHIKLIDFGLVQPAGPSQQLVGGTAFGTAAYLAPEQASGEAVQPATDVYSLACVVYELLTGRPPFGAPDGPGQKNDLIQAHLRETPVAPSEARPDLKLPRWVDDVLGWALAKTPAERFPDVLTFAQLFRSGLEGEYARIDPTASLTAPIANGMQPPAGASEFAGPDDPTPVREATTWDRIYAMGGRAAKRSGKLRYVLWRMTLILLIGNLLLGTVILVRGGPSALVERFLSIAPDTTTQVSVDELNLRPEPSLDTMVLAVLQEGQKVRVTGLSQSIDDYTFWPVEVNVDGQELSGWVWDGGLAPNVWTGRLGWMQGVVDRIQSVRDSINSAGDQVKDAISWLWPFRIVLPLP
ncbi:MAG: protein kinase [Thermomicrobiales bacterium]